MPQAVEDIFWDIRPVILANRNLLSSEIKSFREKIETSNEIYAPIPGNELPTFNALYSDRNLLKFLLVLHKLPVKFLASPFVDIGCGLGTASLAWIALVKPSKAQISASICIDRDSEQIELAKTVLSGSRSLNGLPEFMSESFPDWTAPTNHIALLSFSLCEIIAENYTMRKIVDALPNRFVVADYRETISELFREAGGRFYGTDIVQSTFKLDKKLAELLQQDKIRVVGAYGRKWY